MAEDGGHLALQRLAAAQWQVLKIDQIHDVGFTRHQVSRLTERGILHHRCKGIYTYATARPPYKGVLLAAQWSCGDDAYLTGRTALATQKICGQFLGRIDVAVPRRTVRARQPPISLHRTRTPPERLRADGPLRYAPVPQALLDLAAGGAGPTELDRLITEAIHLRRLDHPEMRAFLTSRAGHAGITSLTTAYRDYLPRRSSKSGLERAFDAGLLQRPWIPGPVGNVHRVAGGISWELDRYWPAQRVAVELQGGGYHDARQDREKDELKAAKLAAVGVQIIAFSEMRWELEPNSCLDDLEGLLTLRGWRRAA